MIIVSIVRILQSSTSRQYQKRAKSAYTRSIAFFFNKRNLLFTNSITSGGFMVLGDLIQQEIEYQSHLLPARYDLSRCGRMFTVGAMMGPLHHYYYVYLDKFMPKSDVKTVISKILCDQLFASPATILCFFFGMGMLEHKKIPQCIDEIKSKFIYVYMGDCLYWPPVQFLNFYFLPTKYRVLYINAATMVFNVFLSFMKHYDQH